MKKLPILLLILLCIACHCGAQQKTVIKKKAGKKIENPPNREFKNSIYIVGTTYYFTKIYGSFLEHASPKRLKYYPTEQIADQFGFYYERNLYKSFRIATGYIKWNNFFFPFGGMPYGSGGEMVRGGGYDTAKRGSIIWRYEYSMADLLFIYRYNRFKKHKIDVCIGPSYAYGKNWVYDTSYYGHVSVAHEERAAYYGITTGIAYDYICLKNRVGLGYNFRWRKYFDLYGAQIDYGLHIKFNF
ncbi:MAG: hypothetical protein K0Q79_2827 [Flavipsychrobacter sp.]|jgi:hypothetical protein|nr:hypothetical protein [Flavipsychrobacter sp.]